MMGLLNAYVQVLVSNDRSGSRNYGDRDKGLATVVVVREPIEVPHDPS